MRQATLVALVGLIVGIVGVGASIGIPLWLNFGREGETRDLDILVWSDVSGMEAIGGLGDRISVLFDGEPVSALRMTDLAIENTGNQELRSEDFDGPLELAFEGEGQILDATITQSNPPDIRTSLSIVDGLKAQLEPALFNAGDSVRVRLISSTDLSSPLVVTARIAGIKSVDVKPVAPAEEEGQSPSEFAAAIVGGMGALLATALVTSSVLRLPIPWRDLLRKLRFTAP